MALEGPSCLQRRQGSEPGPRCAINGPDDPAGGRLHTTATGYTNVITFPLLHQLPPQRRTLLDAWLSGRKAVVWDPAVASNAAGFQWKLKCPTCSSDSRRSGSIAL